MSMIQIRFKHTRVINSSTMGQDKSFPNKIDERSGRILSNFIDDLGPHINVAVTTGNKS